MECSVGVVCTVTAPVVRFAVVCKHAAVNLLQQVAQILADFDDFCAPN